MPSSASASTAGPLAHLSPSDRTLFYKHGLGPSRPVPVPIVHHAFQLHAQQQPTAIAVEHTGAGQSITYAHLHLQSDRLAHTLRTRGIVPGTRVCILARRSVPLIVAILAVLKSGGQYVPLDALTITDETLDFVLNDATPSAVLVMDEFSHRISNPVVPIISLEKEIQAGELGKADPGNVEDFSSPTDGAYCIYTSGTTGKPKGVDVKHQGVTNVISGSPGNVGMRPGMRVAQLLNIAFDMGAWEILGSLYNGATLCLRGNTSKEWFALMKTVDIVIATPSILTCHDPENYPNIKHVIVGGEPCPQALADKWARHTNFNNCCGPTEISICNTVQPHTPGYPLSIGTPIPNTNVYILSRDPSKTRAVPIGAVGCMWVGGIGVGSIQRVRRRPKDSREDAGADVGTRKDAAHDAHMEQGDTEEWEEIGTRYLNLPEKTAERWLPDPFVPGGRMFNTGDLGRWRKDGQLEHMGRADDQIKVKGFRVELDGVSAAMRAHPPVQNAVALLIGGQLWGFVTPAGVDVAHVRRAVEKVQPYYAVPAHYLALDAFPLTRNGKVDKRALCGLADPAARLNREAQAQVKVPQEQAATRSVEVPFAQALPPPPPPPMMQTQVAVS